MKKLWKLLTLCIGVGCLFLANFFEALWYDYLLGILMSLSAILALGVINSDADKSGLGKWMTEADLLAETR